VLEIGDILPVIDEFENPTHKEFREPTQWNLHNAFTENAKKYSPARADYCYRQLAKLFRLSSN